MPRSSTKTRQLQTIRRERTLAYKLLDMATAQRDQARMVASALEIELKKYITEYGQLTPPEPEVTTPGVNKIADLLEGVPEVV